MVAKTTQNLFDVNIGGAGFHVTSHLIALAALFIACFAIAGYISFRDDSVPDSALKGDDEDVVSQRVSIPVSAANAFSNKFTFTQPGNSYITGINTLCVDGYTDGATVIAMTVGTTLDGTDILGTDVIGTVGAHTVGELGLGADQDAIPAQRYTSTDRTVHVTVASGTGGTVTEAGAIEAIFKIVKL